MNTKTPHRSARRRFAPTKRALMGAKRTPGSKARAKIGRGAKRRKTY